MHDPKQRYLKESTDEGTVDRQQVMQMVKAAQEQLARAAAQKSVQGAVGETPATTDDDRDSDYGGRGRGKQKN